MLKVESFKISDSESINGRLQQYPLAQGMHILVSNGEVIVPFEDGKPEPLEVRINKIKEQINTLMASKEVITQSQMVLEALLETKRGHYNELQANIAEAEAKPNSKGKSKEVNQMKEVEAKAAKAMFEEESRIMLNKKEIERMDVNIAMLYKRIEEIGNANDKAEEGV